MRMCSQDNKEKRVSKVFWGISKVIWGLELGEVLVSTKERRTFDSSSFVLLLVSYYHVFTRQMI